MEIIAYKQGLTEDWSVYPKNIPYLNFIILEWETELQPLKNVMG